VFTGVDQALIADGLIDYWQNLDYGHYGITTGVSSPHGVLRDRTYLAKESHLIAQRMSELAAVQNGFDFQIDPLTREFTAVYPGLGVDRTDTLFIDARSVVDPSAQISAGPEDLISDAYAVGENIVAHAVNTALRAAVGRAGFAASFNGVTEQATLDDHAAHILAERSSQLHDPAKTLFAIAFDWDDFGLGDLVSFDYDYGAGLMSEQRRVVARTMGLTREGAQTITVELK
jgi:hypothetical protein